MSYYNNYRIRCFEHHEKKCAICGETRVLEVHHINCNHEDNSPLNLIPLCPNCHRLYHSKEHRTLVEQKILDYQEIFSEYYWSQDQF